MVYLRCQLTVNPDAVKKKKRAGRVPWDEQTLLEKYRRIKEITLKVQNRMGDICSVMERTRNLFLWCHPTQTQMLLQLLGVVTIVAYFVPSRYFCLAIGMQQ